LPQWMTAVNVSYVNVTGADVARIWIIPMPEDDSPIVYAAAGGDLGAKVAKKLGLYAMYLEGSTVSVKSVKHPVAYLLANYLEPAKAYGVAFSKFNVSAWATNAIEVLDAIGAGSGATSAAVYNVSVVNETDEDVYEMKTLVDTSNWPKTYTFTAPTTGYITGIDNRAITGIARAAGAPEDKGAGLELYVKVGDLDTGQLAAPNT